MPGNSLEEAAKAVAKATRILVITGAGISAESGIPTFRGPGGLWEGFRSEELASPAGWSADPARLWRWYRWRRRLCLEAQPNAGHRAISALETLTDQFLLVTQNVDGLHSRSGSRSLVEIHGNIHQGRCVSCEQVANLPESDILSEHPVPLCDICGNYLRPHIVWFGETYWPGVLEASFGFADTAEAVIVIGTSGQVWTPGAIAFRGHRAGAYMIDVNPDKTELSLLSHAHFAHPSGQFLPEFLIAVRRYKGSAGKLVS